MADELLKHVETTLSMFQPLDLVCREIFVSKNTLHILSASKYSFWKRNQDMPPSSTFMGYCMLRTPTLPPPPHIHSWEVQHVGTRNKTHSTVAVSIVGESVPPVMGKTPPSSSVETVESVKTVETRGQIWENEGNGRKFCPSAHVLRGGGGREEIRSPKQARMLKIWLNVFPIRNLQRAGDILSRIASTFMVVLLAVIYICLSLRNTIFSTFYHRIAWSHLKYYRLYHFITGLVLQLVHKSYNRTYLGGEAWSIFITSNPSYFFYPRQGYTVENKAWIPTSIEKYLH